MPQRGNISVNQAPQYGDKKVLEQGTKALTQTPMSGATVPARGAGRPPGPSSQQPSSQAGAPPETQVPPEHRQMMAEYAQAKSTKDFWDNVLANYPSEWSRMYAADANRAYLEAADALRGGTPFFAP